MKAVYRIVFLLLFLLATVRPASAQDEIDQLMTESIEDGRKLIGAYVSPFMKSVSLGLNQGWYNTANLARTGCRYRWPTSALAFRKEQI